MNNIFSIEPKQLQHLPARDFSHHLLTMNAKQGFELLLERSDAAAVVQALPEQDFYLFIKEIGRENAAAILGMARIEQINHILDLVGWQKDHVKAGAMLSWLETLLTSDHQKFLEWLYKVDFELLVILFKQWLEVEALPEDTEYIEVKEWFPEETIDGQFYFTVRYPQSHETITSVLRYLFETHYNFYLELMHHVLGSTISEVEELAYQFHKGRLADNAIPDTDEAYSILKPLPLSRLQSTKTPPAIELDHGNQPLYALVSLGKNNDLLIEALARINRQAIRQGLQMEFAALANKIIVAMNLSIDNPENIRLAADTAGAYVNLALEQLCNGDIPAASHYLQTSHIEDLYRLTQTQITALQAQQRQIIESGWLAEWPTGLALLDPPLYDQVDLLGGSIPMIFRDPRPETSGLEDPIRSPQDLLTARQILSTFEGLGPFFHLLAHKTSCSPQELGHSLWQKAQITCLDSITLGSLALTAAFQELLYGELSLFPLPRKRWDTHTKDINKNSIRSILAKRCTALKPTQWNTVEHYMEPILSDFFTAYNADTAPHQLPYILFTDK